MERPTTDGSGILNPAASGRAQGAQLARCVPEAAVRGVVGAVSLFLSFEAMETSFASATPAATQAAGSGERNQHMVVSETGVQASCAKKPGQAGIRSSVHVGGGGRAVGRLFIGCRRSGPIDWWHRQQGGEIAKERPAPPGADQPYPNMSTVPAKPTPPNQEELKKLTDSLVADRTNAQHAAQAAPLADPSSPTASPNLFGVGTAPPPPPPGATRRRRHPIGGAASAGAAPPAGAASAGAPVASASMPAVTAPAAPPSPAPRKAVQSTPLEAPPAQTPRRRPTASAPARSAAQPPPAAPAPAAAAPTAAGATGRGCPGGRDAAPPGHASGRDANAGTAAGRAAPAGRRRPQPALPPAAPPRPAVAGPPPVAPVVPAPMPVPAGSTSATIVFVERSTTLSQPATDEVKAFAAKRGKGHHLRHRLWRLRPPAIRRPSRPP